MRNQGGVDATLRQRLLASASELGISEEAVLAAQQQWEEQQKKEDLLDEYRSHLKRELLTHFGIYVAINLILLLISRITSPHYLWAIWPILGWGIGFACHAVVTWIQIKNPGGEEFERWKRGREQSGQGTSSLGPRVYGIHIQAGPRAISPPEPPSDNSSR